MTGEKVRGLLVVAALQPVFYFVFETIGVGLTSASESGIMIALIPMAVAVFASFILQERLLPFQWLSILASVGGVVLLTVPRMQESSGQLVGNLALLGAVVFNVLGMGRFTLRSDLPAYFQAFTNLDTAWAIVYLGLFSSVGAFFCLNYALPKLTPSKSAVFINLTQVI